ncbi:hypothetical protein D7Y13_04755 [Corallococcus praedator]|uniref:Uncharacterized protein n=1 Tax=Corallococcus praedator TaxID=2316724 RepID=A0ABX9QP18_9BACT|nr:MULTISPECIES: hypothetical protein [Corallococcus]RKH33886.1 hypothetical protein D7X75_10410 [Corallococcus sp. CA031C]RKI15186.1 hypothetical protein D7Y13_04755 [Corallococcus praedator]
MSPFSRPEWNFPLRSPASSQRVIWLLLILCGLALGACRDTPPAPSPAPMPSPPSGEAARPVASPVAPRDAGTWADAVIAPVSAPAFGEPLPEDVLRLEMSGDAVRLGAESFVPASEVDAARLAQRVGGKGVLLVIGDADTFLAQVSELLAVLQTKAASVWLQHPDAPVAYRVVLRDEDGFRAWLQEVAPGKLRIIQRADGFELTTSVGKLPGPDRNGPTVPVRGGRQDIATLRRELARLKGRFTTSDDLCLVPSFGTEVAQVARALGGTYVAPEEPLFDTLCLVYPLPRPSPAGARDAGSP